MSERSFQPEMPMELRCTAPVGHGICGDCVYLRVGGEPLCLEHFMNRPKGSGVSASGGAGHAGAAPR